jgi:hypothetical protein
MPNTQRLTQHKPVLLPFSHLLADCCLSRLALVARCTSSCIAVASFGLQDTNSNHQHILINCHSAAGARQVGHCGETVVSLDRVRFG